MARTTPVHSGYKIISGSGSGSNGGRIDVWVEYKLGTQNATGNYTPITAYFYAALNPSYSSSTSYYQGLNSSFKVNDTAGTGVSNGSYDFTSSAIVNLLGSYNGNIAHNTDGTKTVSISGSFTTVSSYISGGSVSGSITLPTIARESTISATPTYVGEAAAVSVVQKNKNYTHSVAYRFGSLSGYLTSGGGLSSSEVKFSNTSIPFVIPDSFYEQIPDDPSGTCTLTCKTYSGNTQIGEAKTCTFTITAEPSKCKPIVTGSVIDSNDKTFKVTADRNVLVKFMSTARCTIAVTPRNQVGSITQKRVNGVDIPKEKTFVDLENVETGNFLFEATDSRDYTGSDSKKLTLIPYVKLTNDASVKRTDPTSGKAKLTLKGNCFKGNFGAAENTLTVKYQINSDEEVFLYPEIRDDNTYEMVVDLSGLVYTQTHSITVTVIDALASVPKPLTVNKGIPVFDWGENDFQFHVPVTGDFSGTFEGVYIRTVRLSGSKVITIKSKETMTETSRQSLFIFGDDNYTLTYGLVALHGLSGGSWSGTGTVDIAGTGDGRFTLILEGNAYDYFTLISAEPFEIL